MPLDHTNIDLDNLNPLVMTTPVSRQFNKLAIVIVATSVAFIVTGYYIYSKILNNDTGKKR